MHLCENTCMYIGMHVCIHVCMHVIFNLGFKQYGRGNCPSWEGKLSGWGELSRGIIWVGECPFPHIYILATGLLSSNWTSLMQPNFSLALRIHSFHNLQKLFGLHWT